MGSEEEARGLSSDKDRTRARIDFSVAQVYDAWSLLIEVTVDLRARPAIMAASIRYQLRTPCPRAEAQLVLS